MDAHPTDLETSFFESEDYEERAFAYDSLAGARDRARWARRLGRGAWGVGVVVGIPVAWMLLFGGPTQVDRPAAVVDESIEGPASSPAVVELPADDLSAEDEPNGLAVVVAAAPAAPLTARTLAVLGGRVDEPRIEPEPEDVYDVVLSPRMLSVLTAKPSVRRRPARRAPRVAPARRRGPPAARKKATPADSSDVAGLSDRARTSPADPSAHFQLALALHDQGRSAAAIPHLQKAVRVGSGHADSLLLLGSIYQSLGRTGEGRRVYEQYLEKHPTGAHAAGLRTILSRL